MKLNLTLLDEQKNQYGIAEEYARTSVDGFEASARVTAALLRGIADEIDPSRGPTVTRPTFANEFVR